MFKKLVIILSVLYIVICVGGVIGLAQTSGVEVTVRFNVPHILLEGIEAFEDEECTIPLTMLDFGDMDAGEIKTLSFYVKNIGEVDRFIQAAMGSTPGFNAAVSPSSFDLPVGAVQKIDIEVQLPFDVTEGERFFSVYFN